MSDLNIEESEVDTGFWLAIPQRDGPNKMIRVTEREWRRHRALGGGSPPETTRLITDWEIFR